MLTDTSFPVAATSPVAVHPERAEAEIDRIAEALGEKFEEIRLIHDLTEQLCLDQDVGGFCVELLDTLKHCLGVENVAIELAADADSGFSGQWHQVGEPITPVHWQAMAGAAWGECQNGGPPTDSAGAPIDSSADAGDRVALVNEPWHPLLRGRRIVVVPIRRQGVYLGQLIAMRLCRAPAFGTSEIELLRSALMIVGLHLINQRQYREVQHMFQGTVQSLASALDAKDAFTGGHSSRVASLASELASRLGYTESDIARIRMAGTLHDIGKIGVEDSVLLKPGRLTEAELDKIKQHPVLGYEILKGIRLFRDILPAVRHHHESWDGNGYPDGLRGTTIPRDAQVLAVADAFDAMVSDRPYRKGMSLQKVVEILRQGRDKQWAGDVVDVLLGSPELLEEYARQGTTSKPSP